MTKGDYRLPTRTLVLFLRYVRPIQARPIRLRESVKIQLISWGCGGSSVVPVNMANLHGADRAKQGEKGKQTASRESVRKSVCEGTISSE